MDRKELMVFLLSPQQSWGLHIESTIEEDTGVYECQTSAYPPKGASVKLTVLSASPSLLPCGFPDRFFVGGFSVSEELLGPKGGWNSPQPRLGVMTRGRAVSMPEEGDGGNRKNTFWLGSLVSFLWSGPRSIRHGPSVDIDFLVVGFHLVHSDEYDEKRQRATRNDRRER